MKSFSSLPTRDQAGTSNRRQPVRQTRTNPARHTTVAQMPTSSNLTPVDGGDPEDLGFFPAITHYTDSITALPKELIRHYTMLKEVDAKIYGPEAELGQLFNRALTNPPSRTAIPSTTQDPPKHSTLTASDPAQHRLLFQDMRRVMNATLAILDEKNHVMNTAMEALDRQIRRCQSSFPYIGDEISEEARYGSFNHWAYTDKAGEKKSILVGERTRRSQNIQDAKEAEGAALRSDIRREAMKGKGRNQHVDSDFDEIRIVGKKGQPGPKGRKLVESGYGINAVGLGIANAATQPNKRRKTEKAALAALPIEKAMTSVYGSQPTASRGRDPTAAEPKRKPKAALATNGNTRRRGNTNTSGINSPLASSPIMGTFAAPGIKDRSGRSPAPPMQRMPSSRARQNSTQNVISQARNRSSSMNHKNGNAINGGNTPFNTNLEVEKISHITSRATNDAKSTIKEALSTKGEHQTEDIGSSDGPGDTRGGLYITAKNASDRTSKREEQTSERPTSRRAERPAPVSIRNSSNNGNGNGGGGGTSSKAPSANPTPRDSSFGERARQPRGGGAAEQPQKRSHKKGAGLAAQLAAQAARKDDDGGSSAVEDDDEGEGENEPLYCYCQGVSYGEMVGCDAKDCRREWFHLPCVGMTKPPPKTAKWYCEECKENLKNNGKKTNGTNGR